jgi:hypothetical protein
MTNKRGIMFLRFFIFFLAFFGFLTKSPAQKAQMDTSYVFSQSDKLVTRFYLSRKYTDFVLSNPNEGKNIRYIPSSGVNLGIGVTYQKFTINLGFPIDIFNPSRQKDFPDLLDLQSHLYTTNWMVDFFGQFYTGYTIPESSKTDYSMLREDMKVRKLGILAGYILKGEQISLQAASQQSAIQKRSAFSPLVGFEAYRVLVKGDSVIFPLEENFETNFIRSDYFHFGPNAGLVGSLVFGKGFFITGALIANLGAGYSRWDKKKETSIWQMVPGYAARGYAGFNNRKFSVNVNYVFKYLELADHLEWNQSLRTGNYRFNLVYKFGAGKRLENLFEN